MHIPKDNVVFESIQRGDDDALRGLTGSSLASVPFMALKNCLLNISTDRQNDWFCTFIDRVFNKILNVDDWLTSYLIWDRALTYVPTMLAILDGSHP